MNEQGLLTGLRNERKPCHFWVDNEVADCYQPIVGADAIWVYCRIARNAHGAWIVSPKVRGADTRVSLREMAEWCGKSVDTVWRCLQVLELVGLLQADRGAKIKGRYALADVKDLVTREGGLYDREMGSFRLPEARVVELKDQVRALRLKMARKKAGQIVLVDSQKEQSQSVAQSDRFGSDLFGVPDAKCDRSVAPDVQICRSERTASITTNFKKATKANTTPQPPLAHPNGQRTPVGDPAAGECGFESQESLDASKTKIRSAGVAENAISPFQAQLGTAESLMDLDATIPILLDRDRISTSYRVRESGNSENLQRPTGVGRQEVELGEHEVTEIQFTEDQLEHLARVADRPGWEVFYREENRARAIQKAKDAEVAQAESQCEERLKAELCTVEAAAAYVMRECDFQESRRRRGLRAVIESVLSQGVEKGDPLWKRAPKMAQSYKYFLANGPYIDVHWGPVNFFRLGIWVDSRGWAWNQKKLEQRGASVGSVR